MLRFAAAAALIAAKLVAAEPAGIYDPAHGYFTRTPTDRFTRLKADLEAGRRSLDTSGELALLQSLLRELEVPVSSQMWVFSVTSLQKRLISPRRPRALYFNEDTYVGYVPGGQIEIVSIDPELGGIFYILDRLRPGQQPAIERSEDCMSCHAPRHLQNVPGLLVESVVPGITGGGEKAFRREQTGHGVPLDQRFGGWHVTGADRFTRHWGNLLLDRSASGLFERPIAPGQLFDVARYPAGTSDILPQLLHEHQIGFANRAIQAAYRTRSLIQSGSGSEPKAAAEINSMARSLTRYLLFADEAPLPAGGFEGDAQFKRDFVANRRAVPGGASLKDFDLRTRLFRHRCSYMVYSPEFAGLPAPLKQQVFAHLARALAAVGGDPEFAYLEPREKQTIRTILAATLPEWQALAGGSTLQRAGAAMR